MQKISADITISSVDRERHIVSMFVQGYPVTAVCSPENNPSIYEQLKAVMIGVILNSSDKHHAKLDKKVEI